MKPVTLHLENVGRFADLDLTLPDGCVAIVGPNGAGKSTLLNSVEAALFADGSRDLAPLLSPWADRLLIQLEFEHNGDTYRVRRSFKERGASGTATLDLERLIDDAWVPLTRETAKETQALLERTLGLSRRTFRASSFLAQGDAAAFPEASPAERKQILGEILDPRGLWPALKTAAGDRAKSVDQELAAGRAQAEQLEQQLQTGEGLDADLRVATDARDLAAVSHTESETALERALADEAANATAAERVRAAAAERDTAKQTVDQAREKAEHAQTEASKLPAAREKIAALELVAAGVPELEQLAEEHRTAKLRAEAAAAARTAADTEARTLFDTYSRLARELDEINAESVLVMERQERLKAAEDGVERCHACEQLLGSEARVVAIEKLQDERAELLQKAAAKHDERDAAKTASDTATAKAHAIDIPSVPESDPTGRLAEARAAVERVAAGKVVIESLEATAREVETLLEALRGAGTYLAGKEEALVAASTGVKDTAELAASVHNARQIVASRRQVLADATSTVSKLEERQRALTAAQEHLARLRAQSADRHNLLDTLRLAEKAFGRDGIPALLVENIITVLETDANHILERMPMSDGRTLTVQLNSQRELKTDKTRLAETLDILVAHDDTPPREFRQLGSGQWTFSGGEVFRVAWALRWALAKLLAGRRGAESRVLMVDEPDGLDVAGMDALTEIVKEAATVFETVLVVSHQPQLATAFSQSLQVEIQNGVSRLEQPATDREEVPA